MFLLYRREGWCKQLEILLQRRFYHHPEVKELLWGGAFWTSGFYLNTVGQYGNEAIIKNYVKKQGKTYKQIYRGQLKLFEDFA
jgi:putative transposase